MKTSFESTIVNILLLFALSLTTVSCTSTQRPHKGRFPFNMVEKAPQQGRTSIRSTLSTPTTTAPMRKTIAYNSDDAAEFDSISRKLQAGDVIGFVMSHREAWKHLHKAKIQKVPYEVFRFGHVAVVTPDRTLLSVCMGEAVTADLPLESLRNQSWFAYRAPAGTIDPDRLREFVKTATSKASSPREAYDFTGALGLWNVNAYPDTVSEIAEEYTCATLVIAALNYAGYRMDAVHRGGTLDIVTPRQVIESHGMAVLSQ